MLANGEVIDVGGGRRLRYIDTPHVPHCWDAGVLYEEGSGTLLCGDLFTQLGNGGPLVTGDIVGPAIAAEEMFQASAMHPSMIKGATAFNEMQILAAEGKAGFHLVGFGAAFLVVKPSRQVWEHRRETVLGWRERARLEAAGWSYVGGWFPFQYFKRVKP